MRAAFLSVFYLAALSAGAQPTLSARLPARRGCDGGLTEAILSQQAGRLAPRTAAALTQRLTMSVVFDVDRGSRDSTVYFWSVKSRGAAHNPKDFGTYEDAFTPYAEHLATPGVPNQTRKQFILSDSIALFLSNGQSLPVRAYRYDAANKLVDYRNYENGLLRTTLSYNAAGYNDQCSTTDLTNAGAPAFWQASTYGPAGQVLTDTAVRWSSPTAPMLYKYIRSYDAANRLLQLVTVSFKTATQRDSSRVLYTYNADGLLIRTVALNRIATAWSWENAYKDSMVYTGANPAYTARYTFVANGTGGWEPQFLETSTLNAAGNYETLVSQIYRPSTASWVNLFKYVCSYNGFANFQTVLGYDANSQGVFVTNPTNIWNYYYETYEPVGITEPVAPRTVLRVAPNPAQSFFRIARHTAGPATYRLVDRTGRVVLAGCLETGQDALETDRLARGWYLLTVCEAGAAPQTERVVLD